MALKRVKAGREFSIYREGNAYSGAQDKYSKRKWVKETTR
jgi:hypothetical protein